MACEIQPVSAFQSTNLNNKIESYNDLAERILRSLGYPFINIEIHRDSLYENISIAVEWFTKYAGYTQEYLVFDSDLYEKNKGVRLDHLFTLQNSDTFTEQVQFKTESKDFSTYADEPDTISLDTTYVCTSAIPGSYFTSVSSLSSPLSDGVFEYQLLLTEIYNTVVESNSALAQYFVAQTPKGFTIKGTKEGNRNRFMNSFDYDLMDYRKVIDVINFEEGSSNGINTLFTIEQTLAQQTYFSYSMGNYGFDLVSWYTMKEWMETREKMLAINRSYTFDPRTQLLRMYPQPRNSGTSASRFYGVISCYVERPIRDVIKEQWVYNYALALTKMTVASVRGKYGNITLFGGGTLNSTDLMTQGLDEKKALEQNIQEGGYGDAAPPVFFVGAWAAALIPIYNIIHNIYTSGALNTMLG
jgi:hypothetical protein